MSSISPTLSHAHRLTGGQLPLDDDLKAQLVNQIEALAHAATAVAQRASPELRPDTAVELATFLAACDDFHARSEHVLAIEALTTHAVDQVARHHLGTHWIGGLTGIIWGLARLAAREGDLEPDFSEDLDEALLQALTVEHWRGDYDLVIGLVGYGLYAMEHPQPVWRRRLLKPVLHHLEKLGKTTGQGLCWHTAPELLPPHQRKQFPKGYHNLGLAHGIAGVIGLLARAVSEGVQADAAGAMLEPAVDWLMAQRRLADSAGFHFPSFQETPDSSRQLAWCYGDFGISLALLRSVHAMGREDWRAVGLEVARDCSRRRGEASAIRDPGLCHGSAGAALIFLRLWQHSGDEHLAEASLHWLTESLAMRRAGFDETAGIFSVEGTWDAPRVEPSMGQLTGLSGVGLCYLSALGLQHQRWDAPLLTDLPPADEE